MVVADEKSYSEVASQISNYIKTISECCDTLQSAGKDCVDNTQGDPAAAKSNANLTAAIAKIQEQMPELQKIVEAMEEQIEKIRSSTNIE